MQSLLGSEYDDFKRAYDGKPRHKALRVNTLKISAEEFAALAHKTGGYDLRANPLCENGFYTSVKPSLDPLYHAGLYYMQEPSAQSAVAAFMPYIGSRVLDLCAAPGGKATQAAAAMRGGVIFCNDTDYKRAGALVENVERLGIKNAVVTVGEAKDYRRAGFDGFFDTLIVDAPCSGGGMMRYESVPYSEEIVTGCAERQRAILDDAAELVAHGGYMLYSTCTFSREEDEANVEYLLDKGFVAVDLPLRRGEARGIGVPEARRIYPHNFDGEGHFYCVLKKVVETACDKRIAKHKTDEVSVGGYKTARFTDLGILPMELPELDGLNVVRAGVAVFDAVRKDPHKRGEASHALVHALDRDQLNEFGTAELTKTQAEMYIRGEQLSAENLSAGVKIATIDGYALGLVKVAGNGAGDTVMKNLYPRRLRI